MAAPKPSRRRSCSSCRTASVTAEVELHETEDRRALPGADRHSFCKPLKDRGVKIAVLYTTYLPLPKNGWYNTWIRPFQAKSRRRCRAALRPVLLRGHADQGITDARAGALPQGYPYAPHHQLIGVRRGCHPYAVARCIHRDELFRRRGMTAIVRSKSSFVQPAFSVMPSDLRHFTGIVAEKMGSDNLATGTHRRVAS